MPGPNQKQAFRYISNC